MSSRQYAPPLRIKLQPSQFLGIFIISSHILTFSVLWVLPIPSVFILLISPMFILSAYKKLEQHGLLGSKNRIQEVIHDSDGDWKLVWSDNREDYAGVQSDSYRHPFISVLNFKTEDNEKCSVILLPDSVDKESFRRLRVLLF